MKRLMLALLAMALNAACATMIQVPHHLIGPIGSEDSVGIVKYQTTGALAGKHHDAAIEKIKEVCGSFDYRLLGQALDSDGTVVTMVQTGSSMSAVAINRRFAYLRFQCVE